VSESPPRRFSLRSAKRERKLPSERDWERSVLFEPVPGPREPSLISDGSGLSFAPSALNGAAAPLDPEDPAVDVLAARLGELAGLEHWRLLARTDDEALFGRGLPPQLVTVAVRRRRDLWTYGGSSAGKPLRAAREAIRASRWRLDPTQAGQPDATVLRLLVTEQTFAGGQNANRRVQMPDLYIDEQEILLRVFVTPRPGYQPGAPNPETPVRVVLPHPVGARRLTDGALPILA